jgi:hypothetical protein
MNIIISFIYRMIPRVMLIGCCMALALATVKVSGAVQPGQRWHGLNVNRQGVL